MKAGILVLWLAILAPTFASGQKTLASSPNTTPAAVSAVRKKSPLADRSRLPPALQRVPLERLSSGALMLLDRNGDLVKWPAASMPQVAPHATTDNAAAAVALDLRIRPHCP